MNETILLNHGEWIIITPKHGNGTTEYEYMCDFIGKSDGPSSSDTGDDSYDDDANDKDREENAAQTTMMTGLGGSTMQPNPRHQAPPETCIQP